ncbi:hypothetical protein MAPG_10686 [Magnaporthiopsis poae ATCC 64411]|uniref:Uncharacterized protein n=1 Tax=Magnaporthiopsis poae (strain ATCC 64411 / 73-15) TaxID=644358 RepID=A0A0C4ED92_MAGP6|nr:hypothetical protein MAPG_10686 [Magnaporthiopsis poae ATCC 64411]
MALPRGGDLAISIEDRHHGPYQRYLTNLLGTHPYLRVLEQFVDEHDWEVWRSHGCPKDEGLTKFDAVVVDIEPGQSHSLSARLRLSPRLESGIAVTTYTSQNNLEPNSIRLFLIEDISRDTIEYFGSRYGLDPDFFEGHVRDQEKQRSGRPLLRYLQSVHPSPNTVSEACTASYFTAGFYRPYKFGDGGPKPWHTTQRIRWETQNVCRHGVASVKLRNSDALFLDERFSVAVVPAPQHCGVTTVIVIFDSFLPLPPPRTMCGYRNPLPRPAFGSQFATNRTPYCGTHRALRLDFIDWISNLDPAELHERAATFSKGRELSLVDHLFKVAVANTICFLQEAQNAAEYIENKVHGFWRFKGFDPNEEEATDCMQMLRYFIMEVVESTDTTLNLIKGRFRFAKIPGIPNLNRSEVASSIVQYQQAIDFPCERLISDFEDADQKLHDLKTRAETGINYFVARLSALEAHRAQLQADELKVMNILMFVLGPISTLASILAIQERDRYAALFLLCALGALAVVITLRAWQRFCSMLLRLKDAVGGGSKSDSDSTEKLFDFMPPRDQKEKTR